MPRPPHSKRKRTRSPRKKVEQPESPAPATTATPSQDLPDPDTVLAEVPFTSPKGHIYRILITDQTDPYDPPPSEKKRHKK
jgi:hypothetical protein